MKAPLGQGDGCDRKREDSRIDFQIKLATVTAAISRIFATSLGPFGARKSIIDRNNELSFVKDGFSIASSLATTHPITKVAFEVAKTLNTMVGDGVSSAIVFMGRLISEATELVSDGVHPSHVVGGYRLATEEAISTCDRLAHAIPVLNNQHESIVLTSLGTKLSRTVARDASRLLTDATIRLAEAKGNKHTLDKDSLLVVGRLGGLKQRIELFEGLVLDKTATTMDMPLSLENTKVAVVNSLEMKENPFEVTIELTKPNALKDLIDHESGLLDHFVTRLKEIRVRFVACKEGIDDHIERRLSREGILAIKLVGSEQLKQIEMVTGARFTIFNELKSTDLGEASRVEQRGLEGDRYILLSGCKNPRLMSLIVRGGNKALVGETVKAIKSSIVLLGSLFEDPRVVPGGGSTEAELSLQVRRKAHSFSTKEQLAVEAYSRALLAVPEALSENAGLNVLDSVAKLVADHKSGFNTGCLDLESGKVVDAFQIGLMEPLVLKKQVIRSASEAAIMLLRCDDIFLARRPGKDRSDLF